jgi:GNAT superfamily N-acetyltransferase
MKYIETGIEGFKLRFAERGDAAIILKFIKDLAIYENELDQVKATEELLDHSLFDRNGAEAIIGEYNNSPIGFALFFQSFSTFLGRPGIHLIDLYIEPEMRGKGFGKKVLSYLAKLTEDRDCGRLEWWCHDWNDSAIKLYKKWGAFPINNIRVYRLCENALTEFSKEFK